MRSRTQVELALERRKNTFSYEREEQSGRGMKGTLLFECKVDGETITWMKGAWGVKGTREKLTQ